tara:strand:- start:214 stop:2031 length:1818 start_codon:yes stop_codon:yes gene_type:complete
MALPQGLNRSRSAIAFLVNEAVPGTIDADHTGAAATTLPQNPLASDAFGLTTVPIIGQQGNYSDTSEIGPELITTDRVLNYMEYSTFDLEYYAKPGGIVDQSNPSTSTAGTITSVSAAATSSATVSLTEAATNFGSGGLGFAAGDTIRVSGTGDAANADGIFMVATVVDSVGGAMTYVAKSSVTVASSSVSVSKVAFTLPKEDKILRRCFGGTKFMSTAHNGYSTGDSSTANVTSANATCVSYFLQNTIQTLSVHSRQFTDDSMQMYTATGSLPTSFSVTFAKDGAVTYTSGFQANRVFYTGTAECNPAIGAITSGTNFDVILTSPKRHGKDSTVTATDVTFAQSIAGTFTAGSQVKLRVKSGGTVSGATLTADTDYGPFEVKAISGATVTLGGATTIGSGGISAGTVFLIPFLPDVSLATSVIDQRKVQVFMSDAVKDSTAGENLLDYNPSNAGISDANALAASTTQTQDHLFNLINSLDVTSVNFEFDRAITTPALTEMSGEEFPPASYIINEPTITGSITLLLRPKDFQLMNSLREEPRRAIGVRVGDTEGKIIEMGAASAFFEVPTPSDADGATQIDIPFTVIRGDLGETSDANKFFVRYR